MRTGSEGIVYSPLCSDKNKLPIIKMGARRIPQMFRESRLWITVTSVGKNSLGTGIGAQMTDGDLGRWDSMGSREGEGGHS